MPPIPPMMPMMPSDPHDVVWIIERRGLHLQEPWSQLPRSIRPKAKLPGFLRAGWQLLEMIRKAGLQEYAWLVQDNHVVPSSRAPHTYIYTHEAGRAGRKRPLPPGGLTITTEGGGHFWTENGQSGAAPAGTEGVFACSARDAQGELLLGKCFRRARLKRHVTDRSVKKADVDYIDNYSLLHLGVRELTEQRAFVNQQHAAEAMGMSGIVPGGPGSYPPGAFPPARPSLGVGGFPLAPPPPHIPPPPYGGLVPPHTIPTSGATSNGAADALWPGVPPGGLPPAAHAGSLLAGGLPPGAPYNPLAPPHMPHPGAPHIHPGYAGYPGAPLPPHAAHLPIPGAAAGLVPPHPGILPHLGMPPHGVPPGATPPGFGYGAAPNPAANNGHTTLPPGITGGQPDPSAELAVSETCGGIVVSDDAPEATAVEEFTAPGAAQNGFDHPEAAPAAEPEPKRQHVECAEEESLQSPMREPSQTETQILTETSMTDTGEAIVLWPAMPNPAPTMADADMDEAAPEDELREAVAQLEEAVKQLKEQFPPPLLPAPPAAGVNL